MALQGNHHQVSFNSCFAAFLASVYSIGGPWLSQARHWMLDPSSWPLTCSNPVAFCKRQRPLAAQITLCVAPLLISSLWFVFVIGIAPICSLAGLFCAPIVARLWRSDHIFVRPNGPNRRRTKAVKISQAVSQSSLNIAESIARYRIIPTPHLHTPSYGPLA